MAMSDETSSSDTTTLEQALDRCRALSFDCYGTIIDWETGIASALRSWLDDIGAGTGAGAGGRSGDGELSDDRLLDRFAANETVVQSERPGDRYPEVLAEVLRRIGRDLALPVADEHASRFGGSVGDWPAFDDSADALQRLSGRYALVILSNVDRASFARSAARLGVSFDRIVTAEDVGSYKPDDRNFDALVRAVGELGIGRRELLHVAESLHHDHEPARRAGLASVWVHRRHAVGGFGATPAADLLSAPPWRVPSLAALAEAAGV